MSSRVLVGLFGHSSVPEVAPPSDAASSPAKSKSKKRAPSIKTVLALALLVGGASALWASRQVIIPALTPTLTSLLAPVTTLPAESAAADAPAGTPAAQTEAASPATPAASGGAQKTALARANVAAGNALGPVTVLPTFELDKPAAGDAGELLTPTEPATPDPAIASAGAPAEQSNGVEASEPNLPASPLRATRIARSSRLSAAVYGASDRSVTPPRQIGGDKQLGGLVGAIEPGTSVTIDFVVNAAGDVESAKGRRTPRTVGESLLLATGLHAVKSWRFEPAHKDGEPVSYRRTISFGAN